MTVPAYLENLGLTKDPFAINDSSRVFNSKELIRVVEKLNHMIHFGNLLLLVLGEKGSGKSTILNYFTQQADNELELCHVQSNKHMSTQDIFDAMKTAFGIEASTSEEVDTTSSFQQLLIDTSTSTKRVLLIDTADQLLPEVLLQIGQLTLEQRNLPEPALNIVLFADSTLNNVVTDTVFKDLGPDGIHKIELKGLRNDEIEAFIAMLSKHSPLNEIPFNPYQLKEIIANSRGIPQKIKQESTEQLRRLVDLEKEQPEENFAEPETMPELESFDQEPLVEQAFETEYDQVEEETSRTRQWLLLAGALVTILAVFGIQYFVLGSFDETVDIAEQGVNTPSGDIDQAEQNESLAIVKNDDLQALPDRKQELSQVAATANKLSDDKTVAENEVESAVEPPIVQKVSVEKQSETTSDTLERVVISKQDTEQKQVEARKTDTPILSKTLEQSSDTRISNPISTAADTTREQVDIPDKVVNNEPKTESEGVAKQQPTVARAAEKKGMADKPDPKPVSKAKTAIFSDPHLLSDNLLGRQSDDSLTLQIAGFSSQAAVKAYIKQNDQLPQIRYYKRKLNGNPWYVIIYGFYQSREEAIKAKQNLPAKIQQSKPWIKAVTKIREERITNS